MEFPLERREPHQEEFDEDVLDVAYDFTKKLHKELGTIMRAVVLFGSAVEKDDPHDIDILVIIDDIQLAFTPELQQAYRVIVENVVQAVSTRLHITTLRFSNFWEYVRTADPIIVTVLRDGKPLIDTGFFTPLQLLLEQGRIRPTQEAIWAYYARAPQLVIASKWKVMLGIIDLYWACINSAHAALMAAGVTPQTPEHVAGLLKEHFVDKGLLEEKYPGILEKLYRLQKDIYTRRIESVSGARFEKLHEEADDFVKRVRILLE